MIPIFINTKIYILDRLLIYHKITIILYPPNFSSYINNIYIHNTYYIR